MYLKINLFKNKNKNNERKVSFNRISVLFIGKMMLFNVKYLI